MTTQRGLAGRIILVCIVVGGLLGTSLWGFVPMRWGTGGVRLLRTISAASPLKFQVNDKTAAGTPNLVAGSAPLAAFRGAISAWQSIPTASIPIADLQITTLASTNPDDGLNLITMADTSINRQILGVSSLDPGPVALTRLVFNTSTGKISDTDIVINPLYSFSTTLAPGSYDLQAVATHEIGHALGCDHGVAQNATMFYLIGPQEFFQRFLSPDDIAFASFAYPNALRTASLNSISGKVTQKGVGAVFGASVTAMETSRNLIYTAMTDQSGNYLINGPISGNYTIYAEPLDGPATPDQLIGNVDSDIATNGSGGYYNQINTSFRTTFVGQPLGTQSLDALQDTPIIGTGSMDIQVPTKQATLNIDSMGRGDPDGSNEYLAIGSVVVYPGENLLLIIGGKNTWNIDIPDGDNVNILGTGITVDKTKVKMVKSYQTGSPIGISVPITVAGNAAAGPRTVVLQVGDEQVASTGGIMVGQRVIPPLTLYLPFFLTTPDQYTGVALANPSATAAAVRLTARDNQGNLVYEKDAIVPSNISIPQGGQTAEVDRQIFNLSGLTTQAGSVTVESDVGSVQGFFLSGDLSGNYLDGATAFAKAYSQLYFLDVLQNGFTSTEIHLMNVNDSTPVTVQLTLLDGRGQVLKKAAPRTIPAKGKIGDTVSSIFGYSANLNSAHVIAATTDGSVSLVGFGYVRQPGSVFGLNAAPMDDAGSVLYSPQFSVGNFGVNFSTRLNIVNVGSTATTVSLSLSDDNGNALTGITTSAPVSLAPGAHLTVDAGQYFGISSSTAVQGSVKVTGGTGAKLLGNIVFGDGDPTLKALGFEAALPFSATGSTSFLFSQIAQGQGFYTGVALMALDRAATVTVQAYAPNGTLVGSTQTPISLNAGARVVSVLQKLIPSTTGQVGGYVKVSASSPIIGFELFGAMNGAFLSAVPPQKLTN